MKKKSTSSKRKTSTKKVAKKKAVKKTAKKKSAKIAKNKAVKKTAKKITKKAVKSAKLEPDQYFFLYGGGILKSVADLKKALKTMDDVVFYHHVDEHKNDFAAWIYGVFNKAELAEKIGLIKDRQEMINAL